MIANIIAIFVIALCVTFALTYLIKRHVKAKKEGVCASCCGCAARGTCKKNNIV